jgi:hypothetical protein
MKHIAKSIRTFVGAMNYEESKSFYRELGFEEFVISHDMSHFRVCETLGFYLQDYYVKDLVNNSMIFLEVNKVEQYLDELQKLGLPPINIKTLN